jgi:hypothetical protein
MPSPRTALIVAFSLLIALPGLQTRYRFAPDVALSGVRVEARKPPLTLTAWWQGELQLQAEAWFDDHIGFRGQAVRTDNQIGLSVFHEAFSRAVDTPVVGRRMMIYEDGYVRAYDGADPAGDRKLRKRALQLRRVQDGLARRGIAFVLVVAPSKAAIYPEYLPSGFVRPDSERPPTAYDRMLPMLRSRGVHVVDGHAILAEEKARSPHALFPPGGIHWNRYAAALVMGRAWQALGQQLGRPLVDLRCRGVSEDDAPSEKDQETDGADLLNAWHVGHADWRFPRPDLYVDERGGAYRPRVVVVGDSFWVLPASILADHRMASRSDFYYYFSRPGSWGHIFSADAVVVEVSEIGIGQAGYGFAGEAYRQLLAESEGQSPGSGPASKPRQ